VPISVSVSDYPGLVLALAQFVALGILLWILPLFSHGAERRRRLLIGIFVVVALTIVNVIVHILQGGSVGLTLFLTANVVALLAITKLPRGREDDASS
jgi:hypothetical protein